MIAILYLLFFLCGGLLIVRFLLPRQKALYRLWLGGTSGLALLMWLPALAAFFVRFSKKGHLLALLLLALLVFLAWLLRDKSPVVPFGPEDQKLLHVLLFTALPLSLLAFYLQYTHYLRPVNGTLHVGQSTYGDLPMHLGIITSLQNASFPADYSIFPGARLSYPFLADSLSTTFMVLGLPLRPSILIPGSLMLLFVFAGFTLFCLRLTSRKKAAALAVFLLFINGGLGFLYAFDMAGISLGSSGSNGMQAGVWGERLNNILNGWYQTPVNHAEFNTYNLRWSNIIADMLIPQRTFLGGWSLLFPCLYLLYDALAQEKRNLRQMAFLGILAGALPLVHTHSLLALVFVSFAWMLWDLVSRRDFKPWLVYTLFAGLLCMPQLLAFTFQQASSSDHFLRFGFNWVNNTGSGLKDGYLWFYIKNIGLPFLLLLFSLFEKNKQHRFLYAGAAMIFLPAEFILFQPNPYDNNKLLYVAYALCCVPIADFVFSIWDCLRPLRARKAIAIFCCAVFFFSGSLSLARECKSDYQMFSQEDCALDEWIRRETPEHSLFMTGSQHINPVSALAGRQIICGPGLWLYYHGFNLDERSSEIRRFYTAPEKNLDVLDAYQVQYILFGPYEREEYAPDPDAFSTLFDVVYQNASHTVYKTKEAQHGSTLP